MNEHKQSKFIIDVSAPAKRPNLSTTRFFSYDSHTAEIVIQAEKDGKLIDQALVDTVEIYFESVNLKYRPIDGLKWNDTMEIGTDGLYSYILPDDFLNYEGLVAFDVYINYKNGDRADSSNRIIFEQRVSAIDRAAGAVELVYIKDMETAKRKITEQATEITENFLREWNAFEAGSTSKMQELERRIDEQTEIFNNADVYNKAEIEDKLEPFALQTDIAEVSTQLQHIDLGKATKSEVEVERARISNIVASGTITEGNTELIDTRVGADGITYATAGDAARKNDKRLMDVVLKRTANLLDPATLVNGDIGSWAGSTIDTNSVDATKIRTIPIEVTGGTTIVFIRNGAAFGMSVVSLFDSSGNFIQTITNVADKYAIPTGVDAKYIRARFYASDLSLYNGDNPTTTLQLKVFTESMTYAYENYGYASVLLPKTTFDAYKSEIDNVVYFDDQFDMVETKLSGVVSRQNLSVFTSGIYEHVNIPCSAGERFLINGYHKSNWDYAGYIFTNGTTILSYNTNATAGVMDDVLLTAPIGATNLYVNNDNTLNVLTVFKLVATDIHTKVTELGATVPAFVTADIADLEFENKQLKNRVYTIESRNPFDFATFDKGYATFVFDDGRHDVDLVADIFNEYGFPLCLAVPPTELPKATNGILGSTKTVEDVCFEVVSRGGEVLNHGFTQITTTNITNEAVMTQLFKTNKQLLEASGFTVRGIIMVGGTGQLLGGSDAQGGLTFQKWSSLYYDYSDRYGKTPNYYNPRSNLRDGSAAIITVLNNAVTNKSWAVFVGHTLDGTETGLDETVLRAILQHCVTNNIAVVTYAHMIDTFGSTELEQRLVALEV